MNKIYRLVWSSAQRTWVVAGEFAGARGKGTSSLRIAKRVGGVSGFVAAALMAFPADAWVAGTGTSSAALDNNSATNTSINGGAATGGNAIAIGQGSKAPNANNIAMGTNAVTSGAGTIAIGQSASATTTALAGAVALGINSNASADGSIAVGTSTTSSALNTVAIGRSTTASGVSSVGIGDIAKSIGDGSVAIGGAAQVTALGDSGVAIGWKALSNGESAVAIGKSAAASGQNSTAMGVSASATGVGGTAIGSSAISAGLNAMAAGVSASSAGDYSTALGNQASSAGKYSTALGYLNNASQINSTAVGSGNQATGLDSVAMGYNSIASNQSSVAIGDNATGSGFSSVGIGMTAVASGKSAVSIGYMTSALAEGATAVGDSSYASKIGDAAFGYGAKATGGTSIAMGNQAISSGAYSTAVGGSTTTASGTTSTALGSSANATGSYSTSLGGYSTAGGNSSVGIGYNSYIGSTADNAVAVGATTRAGKNATALGSAAQATNANDVALGAGSVTAATVATSGVTIAGNAYTFAGITPASTVSVGSVGNERTVTNVAAGRISTTSTDAINGSQLFATNSAISNVDSHAVKYDTNPDGTVNYNSVTMGGPIYNNSTHTGGTKITNVADGSNPSDAVNFSQLTNTNNNINNIYATGTKYFHANSTGTDSSATGTDAVAIGMGAVANVARSVALGDGATTLAAVGTAGTKILGVDYAFAGTAPVGTVSIGSKGSERTLTNLAAGSLSATSTDGINGSQLFATNSAINNLDDHAVKYDTNVDGTVNYNNVTMGGDTYDNSTHTGGTKITNIADGSDPSDAVNFNQLVTYTDGAKTHYYSVNDGGITGGNYNNDGATGVNAMAAGVSAKSQGENSVALGNNAQAYGDNSISLGNSSTSMRDNSVVIGNQSVINGNNSYSLGNYNLVDANNAVVIGNNIMVEENRGNLDGSIVLGDSSTIDVAVGTSSTKIGDATYTFAGSAPIAAMSVGSVGAERTITNVAAGRLSRTSTDGVNGSQLFATNSAINNVDSHAVKYDTNVDGTVNYNNITMGGDTYDNSTHTGGTKITNIADGSDPSDAVNFSQLTTTNNNVTNLGDQVNNIYATGTKYFHANSTGTDSSATGIDAVAIGMGAVADVARSVALGDGAKTLAAEGTSGTTLLGVDYAFAGTSPVGTVSIGDAGSERTLTNMAAGRLSDTSTDGVNGSQLFATNTALNSITASVTNMDAGTVHYNKYVDGTVNYNSVTMGGDTYDNSTHTGGTKITNVADGSDPSDAVNFSQLTETNNNVTNLGDQVDNIYATGTKYFHANSTGTDSSATGLDAVAIGMGAVADVARSVALGDGAKTEEAVATTGATIRGTDYAFAGAAPVGTVSIGSAGNERTLTNMAAGRLNADSTDGVNGSQLYATNQAINSLDISFTDLDNHAVKYDTHVDGTVNYNSVTMGGDTYNSTTHTGGTKISNVADGSAPSDAVNFSQLTETNNSINNVYSNGTKYFHANSTGADSSATGADAVAIGQSATASAMNSIAIGNGAEASTASSVALGDGAKTQAAVGTSGITIQGQNYAFAGTAPVGTVSVGDAGAERTITNVAAGQVTASSTDAVNGSQLYAVADAVNNISGDITNLDNRSVKYDVNNDGTTNYNKVVMGGDTYDNSTHTGGTTISNVANGVDPSDAVNFAQLEVVSTQVTNISNGTDGMFQVNNTSNRSKPVVTGKDATAGGAGSVASGDNSVALGSNAVSSASNSVALGADSLADRANSVSVGSAGNERQITNVAPGTSGTDAVNVNQLKSGIADANQYTDNKFGDLKNLVDGNKDKLSAGIAGAMAMASLPQPYAPGASMVSMGGGTYQNQSAVALGVSAISDNGKWVTKLSGTTNSQGDLGAAVGVGYQW